MSDYFVSQSLVPAEPDETEQGVSSNRADSMDGTSDRSRNTAPMTPVGSPSNNVPTLSNSSGPIIHVSNTFHLNANLDFYPPNLVLVSSDMVFFVVHYRRLVEASHNNFGGLLVSDQQATEKEPLIFSIPRPSDVLNVILHCIYGIPCDHYHPTLECLAASLLALQEHGLSLPRYLSRGTPLYNTLLNYAPLRPIDTYALAASHELEDLAVAASSYTLHIKVYDLPRSVTDKMGTWYLQRLHRLHASRMEGLKALLEERIFPHVEKPYCSAEERKVVSRAYHLAGARIYYDATPAISRPGIEIVMQDLIAAVACPDCKESLKAHVEEIVVRWMLFQHTI